MKTRSGFRARQHPWEIDRFIRLLVNRNARRYLEIGACYGDTFYKVMRLLPQGSLGVAVDLPDANWGKVNSVKALKGAVDDLCSRGYDAHYILGDSHDPEVIEQVHAYGKFDAVLIDGDHVYESVKQDWENYGSLAPVVAFHDIAGHKSKTKRKTLSVQVPKLWAQLPGKKVELVKPGSSMGIGVVFQ